MPDYSVLYKELFQAVTRAIDALQEAQINTEELYIASEPAAITILHSNAEQYDDENDDNQQNKIANKELLGKIIGENIRALRLNASMSIEELSEKMEITPGYLGLLERGRRSVTTYNLCCLSKVFNIPIDDFFQQPNLEDKEVKEISAT